MARRLKCERHCPGWPERVDALGRVTCACGAIRTRSQSLRKTLRARLVRVVLGQRVRDRLRSFW